MVRTFTFFIAVLATSCVSAAPLDSRKKAHHKAGAAAAQTAAAPAVAATDAATPTVAAVGSDAVLASITAAASAASASAAAAQQALINANTVSGELFTSPEFEGEEAFLNTKIDLEQKAGLDAEAAQDKDTLNTLNQNAGGGF